MNNTVSDRAEPFDEADVALIAAIDDSMMVWESFLHPYSIRIRLPIPTVSGLHAVDVGNRS